MKVLVLVLHFITTTLALPLDCNAITQCTLCQDVAYCTFIVTRSYEQQCVYKTELGRYKIKSVLHSHARCQEADRFTDIPKSAQSEPFKPLFSAVVTPRTVHHLITTTDLVTPAPTETTMDLVTSSPTQTTIDLASSASTQTTMDLVVSSPTQTTILYAESQLFQSTAATPTQETAERTTEAMLPTLASFQPVPPTVPQTAPSTATTEDGFLFKLKQSLDKSKATVCNQEKDQIQRVARSLCWVAHLLELHQDKGLLDQMQLNPLRNKIPICSVLKKQRILCRELKSTII